MTSTGYSLLGRARPSGLIMRATVLLTSEAVIAIPSGQDLGDHAHHHGRG